MKETTEKRRIKLPKCTQTLLEPGIIKMFGHEGEYIGIDDIKEIREANVELSDNKPFCILLDGINTFYTIDSEARKLLASAKYAEKRMAAAIVVKSMPARMMGNFFIKVNKPHSPTMMFSNEEEAILWLRSFLNKEHSFISK